ncbi:hypothetical protein [Ruegeria sp. THAF57]|uniref:hypothetical protein n=1 Tax=Ruegeria sp. THAF57 TaxID=2744555 RepID=UPI0015DDFFBF|nr:hypothetical protein [Ruegeria sp. THAF57]
MVTIAVTFSSPVAGLPSKPTDRAELFAVCSGRLEALAARQKAHLGETAGSAETLHIQFDQMLEAVLPWALSEGVEEHQPKRWRVRGWVEVAYLLADMDYSFDAQIAAGAERQLEHHISECRAILL